MFIFLINAIIIMNKYLVIKIKKIKLNNLEIVIVLILKIKKVVVKMVILRIMMFFKTKIYKI